MPLEQVYIIHMEGRLLWSHLRELCSSGRCADRPNLPDRPARVKWMRKQEHTYCNFRSAASINGASYPVFDEHQSVFSHVARFRRPRLNKTRDIRFSIGSDRSVSAAQSNT